VKSDRNGKARALTGDELDSLIAAAPSPRYRALWTIQRHTAARIGEALALRWGDVNGRITFRKATTKTKATRQAMVQPALREALDAYRLAWQAEHGHAPARDEALFPGAGSTHTPMSRQAADKALRKVCAAIGLDGTSTHSFRRSLAQTAVRHGVPLSTVQRLTGHKSLGSLGEYLEPTDDEIATALALVLG
jgi:integrase/recombinase XerD